MRLHDARTLALVGDVHLAGAASRPTFRRDGKQFHPRPGHPLGATGHRLGGRQDAGGDSAPGRPASRLQRCRHSHGAHLDIPAFDGQHLPLNLYLPKQAESRKLPTLVLVHGGPSSSTYLLWKPVVAFWTSLGFAVVEPNIRGSTGFGIAWQDGDNKEKRADAMKDMESIDTWAKAQPWCDGKQIVVGGISYGRLQHGAARPHPSSRRCGRRASMDPG